jgi:hypothetical protein
VKTRRKEGDGDTTEGTATSHALLKSFKEAHSVLLERLDLSLEGALKQVRDAHKEHSRSLAEINDSLIQQRAERLRQYLDTLEKARGDHDERKLLQSARVSVEDEIERLDEDVRKRHRETLLKREQAVEAIREQTREEIMSAFYSYIESIKRAWGDAEATALDPYAVAAVGEMLLIAGLKIKSLLED